MDGPAEVALHLLHIHTGQEQEDVLGEDSELAENEAAPWQEAGSCVLLQLGAEEQQVEVGQW